MPFNLTKIYNNLLELLHLSSFAKEKSLQGIFKRDIENNPNFSFRGKNIYPVKRQDDNLDMQTLFNHLTTHVTDKATNKREFEIRRSERLHWIKYHIEERKQEGVLIFSVEDSEGIRTYIFDQPENYVIILAPYRDQTAYYFLTAYYLEGRNGEKILKKYKRRLSEFY